MFWLRSRAANIGTMKTRLRSNRDTVANTATCEPYNVTMTRTTVVDRALWTKRRGTEFFKDIVPGWNDKEFKGNFIATLLHHSTATSTTR